MLGNGLVNLMNKYGKIDIKIWDQSVVCILVKIIVEVKSEEDVQEVFDCIDVGFSNLFERVSV